MNFLNASEREGEPLPTNWAEMNWRPSETLQCPSFHGLRLFPTIRPLPASGSPEGSQSALLQVPETSLFRTRIRLDKHVCLL